MANNEEILKLVYDKWGEYLETLPVEQKLIETITILCNTIRSLQNENTYLTRLKGHNGIRNT